MSGKEKQGKRCQAGLKQDQTSRWCLFCFPFVAPTHCPFTSTLQRSANMVLDDLRSNRLNLEQAKQELSFLCRDDDKSQAFLISACDLVATDEQEEITSGAGGIDDDSAAPEEALEARHPLGQFPLLVGRLPPAIAQALAREASRFILDTHRWSHRLWTLHR